VAAVRLLFVVSGRAGVWSAPGLLPDQRQINLDGWCAWRLVGANNREVARSARTFPTFHECYQGARYVQHRVAHATTTVRHDDVLNLWAWRAEIDGVPVATSGRLYQRHRECQSNVAQFLLLMPLAATAYDASAAATLDHAVDLESQVSPIPAPRSQFARPDEAYRQPEDRADDGPHRDLGSTLRLV
jgi:hypothetical protein